MSGSPDVGFTAPLYVWSKFQYYQAFEDKSPIFRVGKKAVPTAKTYPNSLKVALKYKEMLALGQSDSQADLGRILGVSQAKVTQMINLLNLDVEIQEFMLDLHDTDTRLKALTERRLRPLVRMSGQAQRAAFFRILNFRTKS